MAALGHLILLTGPSGVGKGTLVKLLLERHPQLFLSISATTRAARVGEEEGVHYYFKSRAEFEQLITTEQLLEWAQYLTNYYGTPRQPVEEQLGQGRDVLLEIEVQGAAQVLQNFPMAVSIFILPPSLEALAERLQGRKTESPEAIAKRLHRAQQELSEATKFQHTVINDQLTACLEQLESILYPNSVRHDSVTTSH